MKTRIIVGALLASAPFIASADAQSTYHVPAIQVAQASTTPTIPPALANQPGATSNPDTTPPVVLTPNAHPGASTPDQTTAATPAGASAPTAPMYPPPPVTLRSNRNPALSSRERRSVALSNEWANTRAMPGRGEAGRVVFTFGATLPSVVCAPLFVCAVELESGETVNNIDIGDMARWKITPASTGSGANATTTVIIKPTDADLVTDLIITTDKRTYIIKLISRQNDWMSRISFVYPEEQQAQWAAFRQKQQQQVDDNFLPSGQNIENLDFNFRITGDHPSWTPMRVYSDGRKTYIQMPPSMDNTEAPALVALGNQSGWFSEPTKEIVNYRLHGDTFVVDKVLNRAALITGVGSHQVMVQIIHGNQI
jgi:P-type conjugative transfer protein TrbG